MSSRPLTRRESWAPTKMRLRPSIEPNNDIDDLDLSYIDDDPLNYFLTPAPSSQDDDLDMELDFDAGIEDAKHSAIPIVRSISPSSLDGGIGISRLPLPRPPTPPRSSGSRSPEPELDMAPTPEPEEYAADGDGEAYIFGCSPLTPPPYDMPFSLKDFADIRHKAAQSRKGRTAGAGLLSPTPVRSSTAPAYGGGQRFSPRRPGLADARGRTRSWSGRLSPHAWREPSPDVWSIEEETEEDVLGSEMGDSVMGSDGGAGGTVSRAMDIAAVKPKKRVRFVLPVTELV